MRARKEIEKDSKPYDYLSLEVLLDIRDLLLPKEGMLVPKLGATLPAKKRGRPRKIK